MALRASLGDDRAGVGFSGVPSMGFTRGVADFGFDDSPLGSDGTVEEFDERHLEGAFFGPAHQAVAGMFRHNTSQVISSFGATARDQGSA